MAYDIRKRETKLMSILNEMGLYNKDDKNIVDINDIAMVINNRTNIPIYEIVSSSMNSIVDIKNSLKNNIIGQDNVIDNLIDVTKRIKFGFGGKCYSMMFMGSSGVGKSMLAKMYAKSLVGENNFIRLDMSEYSDSTSINKILGSSPGYVGYDDNRNILEEVRNKPNSVILLDEIDKAHPSVINLFYQILEEGKIKNSKGTTIRFNNTVIIMTTNTGFEKNSIGFNKLNENSALSSLKNNFSTAFVNRIDNVLVFNRLNEEDIVKIINLKLDNIRNNYKNISINYSDNLINEIVRKCDYYDYGARKLQKIINTFVENIIIDSIINNEAHVYIESLEKEKNTTLM